LESGEDIPLLPFCYSSITLQTAEGKNLWIFFLKKAESDLFSLLHFQLVLSDKLNIKFIEMGKLAVPAPDREVPAGNHEVMGAGDMAVPALRIDLQFPYIMAADGGERSGLAHILDPGDKDAG
jgi:hypothetical protein